MSEMKTVKCLKYMRIREERPYRVCPKCGEHKYRTVVLESRRGGGWLNLLFGWGDDPEWVKFRRYTECKNCHYEGLDDE